MEDGRVGFIDFGIVGRIPRQIWGAVKDLSTGLVKGDYRGMALALVQMGAADGKVDVDKFAADIRGIFLVSNLIDNNCFTYMSFQYVRHEVPHDCSTQCCDSA
jgi:aarF domain-containing kinase